MGMKSLSHIYLGSLYITLAKLEGVARADQCTVGDDVQPGQMEISGQKPS